MKLSNEKLADITVQVNDKMVKAIESIQISGPLGCVLVYEKKVFKNIVTDGDIRRALLHGLTLDNTMHEVLAVKSKTTRGGPITANQKSTNSERNFLFEKFALRQLILVDDNQEPVSVIDHRSVDYIPPFIKKDFSALIMAGGFGTRLRPYTEHIPKPMLAINGRPMLEITIESLIKFGVTQIFLSTHYLPHVIRDHFGDGSTFGVPIKYIHEEIPLGTGGALKLLPQDRSFDNLLVINGDILTKLDVNMFLAHHLRSEALMTLAATQYSFQVPFGVLKIGDSRVVSLEEKPTFNFSVNSGIYFIKKIALDFLPEDSFFNMTDMTNVLIDHGKIVECFPIYERWMDVGRPIDYDLAGDYF
jgi:dTDP-glucose pyrophosphorylase